MLVIPAIDIKNGKCVRLLQGDPDKETIYFNDPVSVAVNFEEQGARLIHVVDLDGAFSGEPVNMDLVRDISNAVSVPIEIGGGIRTIEAVEKYISAGISRIIIGTAIINDGFKDLLNKFSDYIIAGIDARNSKIATHGWKNVSDIPAVDFIKDLRNSGINEIIYTDISTDGMLSGPNFKSIERILHELKGISLIASGGVASIEDIARLSEYVPSGLKGCIVGKAIYDGKIDFKKAASLYN